MTRQPKILFMLSSFGGNTVGSRESVNRDACYQHLLYAAYTRGVCSAEGFNIFGRRLASLARHSYIARQLDVVEHVSEAMIGLQIPQPIKAIAHCYNALCFKDRGQFDQAQRILERVIDEATREFKGRALHTLAVTYHDRGDVDAAVPLFLAAGKAARSYDPLALLQSQWMIAITRGSQGDHKRALADLENLFPLVKALARYYPASYYDFLNSLAVELGEVGRLNEAHLTLNSALASPFAPAYPNWSGTRDELRAKCASATPSVVPVGLAAEPVRSRRARLQRKTPRSGLRAPACPLMVQAGAASTRAPSLLAVIKAADETPSVSTSDWPGSGPGPRAPPIKLA